MLHKTVAVIVSTIKPLIGILRNFSCEEPVKKEVFDTNSNVKIAQSFWVKNNTCDYIVLNSGMLEKDV